MSTTKPFPTFCKIVINPSSSHLALPPTFVSRHLKNNIPQNLTLVSGIGGFLWQLEIRKIGGDYCFANGWNQVVKDARLGFGDFLVFWLINPSTFRVSIFGPHGCEKDLPSKSYSYAQCDSCGKTKCTLNGKTVIKLEDDDDDDDDHYEEEEDDDDDLEIHDDDDDDLEIHDDEEDEDDDDADEDGDPFFQRVISDKTNKHSMALPREFAEATGLDGKKSVIVMDLEGREWRIKVHSPEALTNKRCWLSSGWRLFRERNELSDGDVCLFKFIRSQRRLTLARVIKKNRVAGKQKIRPPPRGRKPDCQTPATEVVKRKRAVIRPPQRGRKIDCQTPATEVAKRKRGRPKGSFKRVDKSSPEVEVVKRKIGRPRGSFRRVKKEELSPDVEVAKRTRSRMHPEKTRFKYF